MYTKYYGFTEPPFNITPNSRFFYASEKHTEALSTLSYAIKQRKGFVVITGEIGSGKTTVCRALINELDHNTRTALITNTHLSGKDLLMCILDDLEIEYTNGSKAQLLTQLYSFLISQISQNNNVVVIIDEAQNLTPSVMEDVRMLSNLETEREKLMQILFIGQPELKKKLALPRLEQLRQRVAVYYHLKPLDIEDVKKYIRHRLKVASNNGTREYFTEEAYNTIFAFSKGVPRLVNQICDSALLTGFLNERETIGADILEEVIAESPMVQLGTS